MGISQEERADRNKRYDRLYGRGNWELLSRAEALELLLEQSEINRELKELKEVKKK